MMYDSDEASKIHNKNLKSLIYHKITSFGTSLLEYKIYENFIICKIFINRKIKTSIPSQSELTQIFIEN